MEKKPNSESVTIAMILMLNLMFFSTTTLGLILANTNSTPEQIQPE